MFEDNENRRREKERDALMTALEDAMVARGIPHMAAAAMLGRAARHLVHDLHRLLCPADRSPEEQTRIYTDALEYVQLAHAGLLSFIESHTEKYGKDVVNEPF